MDGEDRVVGFMGMTGQEIDSLFIDPAYRAKGWGEPLWRWPLPKRLGSRLR